MVLWSGGGQGSEEVFPTADYLKGCTYQPGAGGDREASVPHIKTAGVTDRVLLLQASAVCTVHKSSYCVKARTFD